MRQTPGPILLAAAIAAVLLLPAVPVAAEAGAGAWVPVSESVTSKVKCGWPGLTEGKPTFKYVR
jgi:hypothetical protein